METLEHMQCVLKDTPGRNISPLTTASSPRSQVYRQNLSTTLNPPHQPLQKISVPLPKDQSGCLLDFFVFVDKHPLIPLVIYSFASPSEKNRPPIPHPVLSQVSHQFCFGSISACLLQNLRRHPFPNCTLSFHTGSFLLL